MRHPANEILRRRTAKPKTLWAYVAAFLAHATVIAAAILVPTWIAHARPPLEFNTVTIVPVQALGVPDPVPEPEAPRQREPEPEPEAPKPEPRETKPAPAPSPAPARKTVRREEPPPPPAPSAPKQRRGSALGSDIASSPFGAAGVGLDNPDFTYGYYVDQLLSMIGSTWVRPRIGGRIESLVRFRILRDGTVTSLELLESSGHRAFDDAALRAVSAAAPLPPLPASFTSDSLGVTLVVR